MSVLDWVVLGLYALVVLTLGAIVGRRVRVGRELYTGDRRTPGWAIAVSVVATTASAATFVGGPQDAYAGNLTYLSASIGTVLGMLLVAWLLVPKFFANGCATVYEAIGLRRGVGARRACAGAFLIGRLLASGARLYIAAIPCSLIVFGHEKAWAVVLSVIVLGVVALAYTSWGGIRAVIWTDALQAFVMVVAVVASVAVLSGQIPMSFGESVETLHAADEGSKLRLFDFSLDPGVTYSVWSVLIGFTLFSVAAYGTDQDLAQRLLTAPNARRATRSLIGASLGGVVLTGLFLVVGLMLYLRDTSTGGLETDDTRGVFVAFILSDLPVGLRGLLVAGLFAAAMSSTDSALNAMSSSISLDFRGARALTAWSARLTNALCGFGLIAAAVVFALLEGGKAEGLIPFALGVMVYAYAGLLAAFVVCLFTRRGNALSVVAGLLVGAIIIAALRYVPAWMGLEFAVSFPWQMTIGFLIATGVCAWGPAQGDVA